MSYELRLDEEVAAEIEQYILQRFNPESHQHEAADKILGLLHDIADNPLEAGTTTPGPYRGLKAVKKFQVDGVGYIVQIAYQFSEDEEAIEVIGFGHQPL